MVIRCIFFPPPHFYPDELTTVKNKNRSCVQLHFLKIEYSICVFFFFLCALLLIELSFNILLFVLNYTIKNISIFRAIYSSRPIAIFQITFKIKRSHWGGWIWLTIVLNYDRGTVTFSTFFHLDSAGLCFAKLCSFWICLLRFRIFFFLSVSFSYLDTVKFFLLLIL